MKTLTLALLFSGVTHNLQLPNGLLSAICYIESAHKVHAVHHKDGRDNETSHGVCQIKMPTAKMLGFKGTAKELRTPKQNIYWAGKYLKYQLIRYDKDIRKAVSAYNMGTYKETRKGNTMNKKYVRKVFIAWSQDK